MTTLSPEESSFLQAIIDNPKDDAVRLIYADWLQEKAEDAKCSNCKGSLGHYEYPFAAPFYPKWVICSICNGTGHVPDGRADRAEFIRVQIELSRPCSLGYSDAYHVDSTCPACDPSWQRERELLDKHWHHVGWIAECANVMIDPSKWREHLTFRRGFVDELTCPSADWLAHADDITASHPIQVVRLTDVPKVRTLGERHCLEDYDGKYCSVKELLNANSGFSNLPRALLKYYWPRITFHLPERWL